MLLLEIMVRVVFCCYALARRNSNKCKFMLSGFKVDVKKWRLIYLLRAHFVACCCVMIPLDMNNPHTLSTRRFFCYSLSFNLHLRLQLRYVWCSCRQFPIHGRHYHNYLHCTEYTRLHTCTQMYTHTYTHSLADANM